MEETQNQTPKIVFAFVGGLVTFCLRNVWENVCVTNASILTQKVATMLWSMCLICVSFAIVYTWAAQTGRGTHKNVSRPGEVSRPGDV